MVIRVLGYEATHKHNIAFLSYDFTKNILRYTQQLHVGTSKTYRDNIGVRKCTKCSLMNT